jgi:hypothetical protein
MFRYGDKAYGIQFHFEVTRDAVAAMAEAFAKEVDREKIDAGAMIARAAELTPGLEKIADTVFSRWASPIQGIS